MDDIIYSSVLVLLAFSVVPVLDRTVISRDTAVNLCLFSADRTCKVLAGEIAVVRTDRIRRGQRVVRQFVVLCNLPHKGSCCFPVRQFFAKERMEDSSRGVQRLQIILNIKRRENILGIVHRQMGAVGVVRGISLMACSLDIRPFCTVVFCQTVCGRLRRSCLKVVQIAVLLLVIRKTLSHMVQNFFRKLLCLRILQTLSEPCGI